MFKEKLLRLNSKEEGYVTYFVGLIVVTIVGAIAYCLISLFVAADTVEEVDCAVTSALLGCAVADKDAMIIDGDACVSSTKDCKILFEECLKTDETYGRNRVRINKFIVYNLIQGLFHVSEFDNEKVLREYYAMPGNVCFPDGDKVEHTSVYVDVSFFTDLFFNITIPGRIKRIAYITGEN